MHATTVVAPTAQLPLENILAVPDVWSTKLALYCPAAVVHVKAVERQIPEPEEAKAIRLADWASRLEAKMRQLSEANPQRTYVIHHDPDTDQDALFEKLADGKEAKKMWDGTTISTEGELDAERDGTYVLKVFPIRYSEWNSCTNPKYSRVFLDKSLPLPNAGVGMSVLLETTDGFTPLTRRGIETPVYPGYLYSPGGGPKPGEKTVEALLAEVLEETGLKKGEHFDPSKLVMLAYVSDVRHQHGLHERPELVAYLPLEVDSRVVQRVRDEMNAKKNTPEPDVCAYRLVSTDLAVLKREVVLHGVQKMCPPTEGAMTHLLHYKHLQSDPYSAVELTSKFMQRVLGYKRRRY
jgi:ADP-ribose pyrophosphatase YjhB (NUDIX family)